jgi:hypothetical protein
MSDDWMPLKANKVIPGQETPDLNNPNPPAPSSAGRESPSLGPQEVKGYMPFDANQPNRQNFAPRNPLPPLPAGPEKKQPGIKMNKGYN